MTLGIETKNPTLTATARAVARTCAVALAKHADDPDADPLTIEAQLRASADLLRAERAASEERR